MRLLKWNDGDVCLVDAPDKIPPYAILSHTWGPKDTEVTFEDVIGKAGKSKTGYEKIRFCAEQAQLDGLEYFWVDTCCIDKSSSAELAESLNSMFKWYQDSEICYVYLSDVFENRSQPGWELAFRNCKWFTRGWTLQELLAPAKIKFFSQKSEYIGDKESLGLLIHDITKIPTEVLNSSCPLTTIPTSVRCAWMKGRNTTRPEDQAYALLGIVDVYLPFMYGYGKEKAMLELQKAIDDREKQDISIVQVDEYLSSHHYTDERLRIQRLSGEKLDMSNCYINLAVISQTSERNPVPSANARSAFDILLRLHRLQFDGSSVNSHMELWTMFDSRQTSQGLTKVPRRILIRGRAGAGKTTLCKKITFEFKRRTLWNDLFERVLWVPLRSLKTLSRDRLTLVDFFHYHYFRDEHRFGHIFAERLVTEVQPTMRSGPRSKTLFILDGLDEVTEAWDTGEPMHDLLVKMLDQPNVIITSRPHAQLPFDVNNSIDLELQTMEFNPRQVSEYMKMALETPSDVVEMRMFFERFPLISSLARIPIILDALCFIWSEDTDIKPTLQSMTSFYKYVQQQLMIKDSVRLGKLKASVTNNMSSLQLEECFKEEVDLLEKLAFTGMVNDMIEFEPKSRYAIMSAFKGENERILPDQSIRHLSFLRTSDPHKKGADVSYHFLHLTFQEFFAARYFVRQWMSISQDSVCYLDLKHGNRKKCQTMSSFLAQHKYNPGYDIFWRFVAGLLDEEQNGQEIAKFFKAIEEYESQDLLGPAHQRFVMRCLNEVSQDLALRPDLERRLKEWLIFEIEYSAHSFLAWRMEFPDHVLVDILREGRVSKKWLLMEAIRSRVSRSSSLQQELLKNLLDSKDPHLVREFGFAVSSQVGEPEVKQALLAHLDDNDSGIQEVAIRLLSSQAGEPEVRQALLARLGDKSASVRHCAVDVLASQAGYTEVQRALQARLSDEEPRVRKAATDALKSQAGHPEVRDKLLLRLSVDEDYAVRRAAAVLLCNRAGEPDVQRTLFAWLRDTDILTRQIAIELLGTQASESKIQEVLLAQLNDEDTGVRRVAAYVLSGQVSESKVEQALLARLNDEDSAVRRLIANALGSQVSESQAQNALLALLSDEDVLVRSDAAKALGNQNGEPRIQQALITQLSDEDARVRLAAAYALQNQASVFEVQQAFLARLKVDDDPVRGFAVEALLKYQFKPLETFSSNEMAIIVKTLHEMSFRHPVSWQVESGASSLYTPWGLIKTSVADPMKLSQIIKRSRPASYPVDNLQETQSGSSSWLPGSKWIRNLFFRNEST
ncbi:unnamed protein product [Clonostachys rosea]|uniref:NACHT domain-containing protein n=1 Tax=Bionectria ochroleuca TaxID=29856 RepID=A0ABY6UNU4_BIOOC|nr:unnamed protein product [Clonostachys rosea]